VICDISDAAQIAAAVDQVVSALSRIDILVNNAFDPSVVMAPVTDLTIEQLQRNFEVGPIAYLRLMQACHPHPKTSGAGRVINFASIAGVTGMAGYAPYAMAKEAVRPFPTSPRGSGVRTGSPSTTSCPIANTLEEIPETGVPRVQSPLERLGSPEDDIAPAVLFLASADSRFITGYGLSPDRGR
jgi:3-oxoacyl-[acyl-carrier protein] reductase